jgi:hypothetical protein
MSLNFGGAETNSLLQHKYQLMSLTGHFRPNPMVRAMSAIPPIATAKADIGLLQLHYRKNLLNQPNVRCHASLAAASS